MQFISRNLIETQEAAKSLLEFIASSEIPREKAMVVGLTGDLGSGKTAFTKCLAAELGINEHITSPTFVIMKYYKIENSSWKKLIHIDAYRLRNGRELDALGFQNELEDPTSLIVIEWPEIVKDVLPEEMTMIRCRFEDENTRQFVW